MSLSDYKLHDFSSPFFAHLLICFILSFPAYLFVSPLTGQKNGHLIAPESLLVVSARGRDLTISESQIRISSRIK